MRRNLALADAYRAAGWDYRALGAPNKLPAPVQEQAARTAEPLVML
ncbi:hypothetical protein [Arthrobacter globiformis]|nr:hypothetical protein [Arthrobacter globiformis]MDQ0866569.1 hypothetical protein [Arthrobacter globiformis]